VSSSADPRMPRRVLQVSRAVIEGGIDYHAEIARGLAEQGAEITTVFQRGWMSPERLENFPGTVVCLDANRRRLYKNPFVVALRLWSLSLRRPFDLAICHHLTPARAVNPLVRVGRVKKAYLVVHDYDYFAPGDHHGRKRNRFLSSVLGHQHWGVIGVSHAICANVQAHVSALSEARCSMIHNAIDIDSLERQLVPREAARRALGLRSDSFVFGTIGRLVSFKAHEDLIAAFASVHQQMPNSQLVIIGRGPLRAQLQRQIEDFGLAEAAVLYGFLDQAARYLTAFDAFVLPSHNEPFGLVLLEAMVCKLPIIASDSGATSEILPSSDQLFVTGDRAQLGRRLLDLYRASPQAREQIASAGYRRVHEAFSVERYRAAYGRLLR